ncbi:YncE family protein [Cognatitamlana onchidii]|uniref:YncE family protein n=1 Tax=Cognatitamlana onchidii TaxID=2562860 RepID=UPI0010A6623D|nr:DUF5050 domain-containing protein [Algibacter onchidii]
MKATQTIWTLLISAIIASSCHYDIDDITENTGLIDPVSHENIENRWWILTHKNYEAPGIYLYNETTQSIELQLDLPENLESPHALAYDGEYLWVGGAGDNESIYQLDAENGSIISEIKNITTEGITAQDEFLYYSNDKIIHKINKDGTFIEEIPTKNSSYNIPDIAIDGNHLYYLRYSEQDPVIKIGLSDKRESKIALTESTGTYCLTIYNNEIITVNAFNEINRFNLETGVFISTQPTLIKGWITAIEPYYTY